MLPVWVVFVYRHEVRVVRHWWEARASYLYTQNQLQMGKSIGRSEIGPENGNPWLLERENRDANQVDSHGCASRIYSSVVHPRVGCNSFQPRDPVKGTVQVGQHWVNPNLQQELQEKGGNSGLLRSLLMIWKYPGKPSIVNNESSGKFMLCDKFLWELTSDHSIFFMTQSVCCETAHKTNRESFPDYFRKGSSGAGFGPCQQTASPK